MSTVPKKRACVACHKSKVKCNYATEDQTKCDRCLKTNRECVPHVSRQGKKPEKTAVGDAKGNGEKATETASSNHRDFAGCGDGQDHVVCGLKGAIDTRQANGKEVAYQLNPGDSNASLKKRGLAGVSEQDQSGGSLKSTSNNHKITCCLDLIDVETDTSMHDQVQGLPDIAGLIPVKQWIRQALLAANEKNGERVGDLHLDYLKPCLKIAIALAKQVSKAEELARYGINDQIDLLPIDGDVDWASHTMVRLEEGYEIKASGEHWQPLPYSYARGTNVNGDGAANTDTYASNLQMGSFLKTCGVHEIDAETKHGPCKDEEESDEDLMEELDSFLKSSDLYESVKEDGSERADACQRRSGKPTKVAAAKYAASNTSALNKESRLGEASSPLISEGLNFLKVDSAEIQGCHNGRNAYKSASEDECNAKRIFYLGLLLYEMFSGGEKPLNLLPLASCHGAFSSLSTLTLLKDDTTNPNAPSEAKRHQGPVGTGEAVGLCELSVEYLQHKGAPSSICELIFNMLDCVYGDMCGEQCYTSISEIVLDLELMLEKPKLLRGLDASTSSLQLEELSIPRDLEIGQILSCYHRSLSGSSEIAIIKGESGSGKSILANNVGNAIISQNGIFLCAKFDQMPQSMPFSALASAFDQYCEILMSQLGSEWANLVANELRSALGSDACYYLSLVIPKIRLILNMSPVAPDFSPDSGHALERLYHLVCQFVHIISTASSVSVTLFLDDFQWSDEASTSLLKRILTRTRQKFFLLTCCRDDETSNAHPFWNMIENVRTAGTNVTTVKLNCMDLYMLQHVMSDLLYLLPRLVKPLANIVHNKTKGNPLFVSQLMLSLERDRLLWIDLKRKQWDWEEDAIHDTKLPDNIAVCFIAGMKDFPVEVHLALNTLAMLGGSATIHCLKALETRLTMTIIEPLKVAKEKGLVSYSKDTFTFSHDKIQEICYNMIGGQDRVSNHLLYGRCLIQFAQETNDDVIFFIAITQINLAGPASITNGEEYSVMAQHNLIAGKKAVQIPDFNLAYSLFQHGIDFIQVQDNHWARNYDLSLQLHEAASQSSLASGRVQTAHFLSNEVFNHARCFQDKLNTYFLSLSLLSFTSIAESLKSGLTVLSLLGEDIPSNPSEITLHEEMQRTVATISSISVASLINHRRMTDVRLLDVMRFLAKLNTTAFFANHMLHSYVILKMVQLSISMGLAPVSPVAFATFGSMLVKIGNIQLGGGFVTLAKSLSQKISKDTLGEVMYLVCEVQCYLQPLQAANELHIEGAITALSCGDINYACFNRVNYAINVFWSGADLSIAKEKNSEASTFVKQYEHGSLLFLLLFQNTINLLMGSEVETQTRTMLGSISNPRLQMVLSFHDLYIAFIMQCGDLRQCVEKFLALEYTSGCALFNETSFTLIVGLAAFRLYRETRDPVWTNRGQKRIQEMRVLVAQGSSWNFKSHLDLLQAEDYYSNGNFASAKESYKNAITAANESKFLNSQSLAAELAANFYLEIGDVSTSFEHYMLAQNKCSQWGASAKANNLMRYMREKFSSLFVNNCSRH